MTRAELIADLPRAADTQSIMTRALVLWCRDRARHGDSARATLDALSEAGFALVAYGEDCVLVTCLGIDARGTRTDDALANWCEAAGGKGAPHV